MLSVGDREPVAVSVAQCSRPEAPRLFEAVGNGIACQQLSLKPRAGVVYSHLLLADEHGNGAGAKDLVADGAEQE